MQVLNSFLSFFLSYLILSLTVLLFFPLFLNCLYSLQWLEKLYRQLSRIVNERVTRRLENCSFASLFSFLEMHRDFRAIWVKREFVQLVRSSLNRKKAKRDADSMSPLYSNRPVFNFVINSLISLIKIVSFVLSNHV